MSMRIVTEIVQNKYAELVRFCIFLPKAYAPYASLDTCFLDIGLIPESLSRVASRLMNIVSSIDNYL
jgi:hypothetical protein